MSNNWLSFKIIRPCSNEHFKHHLLQLQILFISPAIRQLSIFKILVIFNTVTSCWMTLGSATQSSRAIRRQKTKSARPSMGPAYPAATDDAWRSLDHRDRCNRASRRRGKICHLWRSADMDCCRAYAPF